MIFYEKQSLGKWWPCVSAARPETKTVGGVERLKTPEGIRNPVRNIIEVPPRLAHLPLSELADALVPYAPSSGALIYDETGPVAAMGL